MEYTEVTKNGLTTITTPYGKFTCESRDDALRLARVAERREKQRQLLERRDMATRCKYPHLNRRELS